MKNKNHSPDEHGSNGEKSEAIVPASDRSLQAEASSAHSRINIPLNLDNWKSLPADVQTELMWFHQWILDNHIPWNEAAEALGYDRSTVFRTLKGTYTGRWENIARAIRSFKKLVEQRASIQQSEFAPNSISKIIFAALDYALANNSITAIEGESRTGKSISGKAWCQRNNHGRAVFVTAPVVGGIAGLVRKIAERCGINRNRGVNDIVDSLYRAFNKNRILVIDEAHRCMPNDMRVVNPQKIEFLRDLHDQTGCALALMVTARFSHHLKRGTYQYEQLIGRIGMPVRIKPTIKRSDIEPIVEQFVKRPSEALLDELHKIANRPGRLGIMVETLKAASRIAAVEKEKLSTAHVMAAIAIRTQHSGEEVGK